MPEDEYIIFYETNANISCFSSLEITPNPEPIFIDQPTQNCVPFFHPLHRNRNNGHRDFKSL
jgi:hypothetical protein